MALSACQHATVGNSSASFVDPANAHVRDARELKLEASMEVYVDAKPIEPLTMPRYPSKALEAHAGDVTVRADVTVSAEGGVSSVVPDGLDFSGFNPFHGDFFAAVEEAVRVWRFEPASIDRLEPSHNGQPVIVGITPQERTFTVVFKFTESGAVSRSIQGR